MNEANPYSYVEVDFADLPDDPEMDLPSADECWCCKTRTCDSNGKEFDVWIFVDKEDPSSDDSSLRDQSGKGLFPVLNGIWRCDNNELAIEGVGDNITTFADNGTIHPDEFECLYAVATEFFRQKKGT
jgi:hypothetical protein